MMPVSNEIRCALRTVAAIFAGIGLSFPMGITAAERPDSAAAVTSGRWASSDNVSMTGTAKAGAKFFLDVVVAGDGSFKGTWDQYVCFNYPGAYGVAIVSCQRARKPEPASGRLDAASRTGQIELKGLGKSSFQYKAGPDKKGQPQLDIELPRGWLKQGDPVLYETSLNPRSK
jgi:hypothetical protein